MPEPDLEITVDRDLCMGSGNCLHWAPGVFELDGDDVAHVVDAHAAPMDKVLVAAQRCPTGAITVRAGGEA